MTHTVPLFLERVSPAIRKVLVSERLTAMRGRLGEVCDRLKAIVAATSHDKHADLIALGLLWSELLHLNRQDTEGLTIFKEIVEPRQNCLTTSVQLVITDNLSMLQMADSPGEGVSTFYHLVDRRRVAQFETAENHNLLTAQSAIERDRFNEALPLLWQNLLRAYALGSWQASRWAAERIAKLYLKAGELELACHYLIVAEGDRDVEQLAVAISHRCDPDLIRAILRRIMDFANLGRHFAVACKIIAKIPDFIPDGDVEFLAEWLLPRCRELSTFNDGVVMREAWEAVQVLGTRISQATSRRFIEAALLHPEWQATLPGENRVLPNRKVLVKAVTFLAHSCPKEYLPEVVEVTLPLAIERIQDHDYGEVINLLCDLSQLGGDAVQARIKTALYLPGKPVNRILAQVAGFFEIEALNPVQWEGFANNVIEETRLTVQRLKPGESPKPVNETLMTMTQTSPTGQLVVTIHSAVGLGALVRGKKHLSDPMIERIIRTLIEMATNRDNLLSNRELLLFEMCEFADRAHPKLCDEVVRTLAPLTRGEVLERVDSPDVTGGRQSLTSVSMNMGSPQQVQAMALVAVATFCRSDTARSLLIEEALFEGFVNPHVTVRRGAYSAAHRLHNLSNEQLLPILMGLRDPDPTAAVAAFAAFAERKEWSLTRPMWKLFLLATRLASQSTDTNLRRHAARALRERLTNLPTEMIRDDGEAILKLFSTDVAHSVREATTKTE